MTKECTNNNSVDNEKRATTDTQAQPICIWASISFWCVVAGWTIVFLGVPIVIVVGETMPDEQVFVNSGLDLILFGTPILFCVSFLSGIIAMVVIKMSKCGLAGRGRALAGIVLPLMLLVVCIGIRQIVKSKDKHHEIFDVIRQGDIVRIEEMIAKRPELVNARFNDDRTVLHAAALLGDPDVVAFLINEGADPTLEDDSGMTPLDIAEKEGHEEAAKVLRKCEQKYRSTIE